MILLKKKKKKDSWDSIC